ncbi:pilus assembly protein [Alsobacter soli]|uniref:Pilus assembly protein n=1 Tax=Alsobacter soli TaxID=2109933 RepID=A0A2T1HXN1_9HYPH|nr:pilus assembly protein N-terminal domain-containing protein [Alsobacter soli]PSC06249.1 pilus assembly protein [Alsobacter soli]
MSRLSYARVGGMSSALRSAFASVGLSLLCGGPALAVDSIVVQTDHAQVLKLPPKATTIVIGNPMIADVAVQKNGSMVLTGKAYGETNLIAQDASGAVIGESKIRVEAATDNMVIVQRGMERETYSCAPRCQPTLSLGDQKQHFESVGAQTTARNNLAK